MQYSSIFTPSTSQGNFKLSHFALKRQTQLNSLNMRKILQTWEKKAYKKPITC